MIHRQNITYRQKHILLHLLQTPNQTEHQIHRHLQATGHNAFKTTNPTNTIRKTLKQLQRDNLVTYETTDPHDGPCHRKWRPTRIPIPGAPPLKNYYALLPDP